MRQQTLETVYIYIYIYIYIAGLLSEKHLFQNDFSNLKLGFVVVPEFNIVYQR